MNCMICGVALQGPPLCLTCGSKDWTVRIADAFDSAVVNGTEVLSMRVTKDTVTPAASGPVYPAKTDKAEPMADGKERFLVVACGPGGFLEFLSNRVVGDRVLELFASPQIDTIRVLDRLTGRVEAVK